ncbi:choice-of-anchor L domain-containing protein [Chryseobacterium sp. MFBS3-17]|uniref:choice-of-anchor L domain-containing protein n=1 Tax=Chryseobacterium sp. MFBS3-17 TaxID=2886689 RepID=UPI001D0E8C39|nr:choice-of-anchor L domain-containing protein [Chryseobacterium sp. MFBS3-17]MCC2589767.1 choice-of-anchor L domain-containing protein [Chryseobacterium sp. MFBS3-17]
MKNSLILICLLFSLNFIFGQQARSGAVPATPSAKSMLAGNFIDVNAGGYPQTNYTIQQLIEQVLITGGGNCTANVSNVIVSPNLSVTNTNRSWGYFHKGTTNFPFTDGVVLMTGPARTAGNNFIPATLAGVLGTAGDADLAAAIGVPTGNLEDATYIQFDFVPVTSEITFNYIFASEEYEGSFACSYTDGFALLLKRVTDPNYVNMAVLPGGAGPVSVTNIHPYLSSSCPAVNAQYYAGNNTANIETNFAGRTIPLTATATVIPGETYRFKMVLADYNDTSHDTGVFLQAGSFNIGVQLTDPSGNPLPSTMDICEGSSQVLNAAVPIAGATYQWYLGANPIPGATNSSYTATQAGVYSVQVLVPGTSCPGTAEITINVLPVPQVQDAALDLCSGGTTGTFNLTSAQPSISTTAGATFLYYLNQADAQAGNANTIANPAAHTSGSGIVYVRVTLGQCSVVAQLTLTINQSPAQPVITASANAICGAGSVTLTSSAASGNTWSTGETTQSITITTPGTYTLVVAAGTCTSTPATITIAGDADPNISITGNTFFCTGGSTTLTASITGTGYTFLWSNGAATASTVVSTPGTYTVTVTGPGGCPFTESVTVTESAVPAGQNAALSECSPATDFTFDLTSAEAAMSSTPGVTFTYYTNIADANAGNANNIPNPAAHTAPTSVVYVRISSGNCFVVVELQLTVTVIPDPVITQSAPAICGTTPVTLTSNYATGNVWSTGATTQSITVSTPGTYSLTVSNGACVSQAVSVNVVQNADPNVTITGNLSICQGANTTLTANVTGSGYTFLWSNGSTAQSTAVNAAGTYTVTVTTPAGCQFTASATVTVDAPITINIAQPAQITCTNTTVTLNASGSVFQAGATIQWTASAGGNIVNGANTLTPVVNEGGNYTLTITNNFGNNCSQQQTVTVVENNLPPNITLTAPKITICEGETITLTAAGAQTYTWDTLPGSGNTQVVSPVATTTYTVTGVGANGCQGNTATITITVVPAIVSTLADVQFCEGLDNVMDAGSGPNYTYVWNTGETTQTITVNTPGTYSVTINNGVCSQVFTANASYTEVPLVTDVLYENNTLTITVQNPGTNLEYSIDGGVTWQSSNIFANILRNTTYFISVREKGETCYNTVEYLTFFIGNAITPNGDGINDHVDFTGVSKYKNFSATIHDRYGKEVFRATPSKTVWSGNYTSFQVSSATYWYQVTWTDPISNQPVIRKGWILVKNRE